MRSSLVSPLEHQAKHHLQVRLVQLVRLTTFEVQNFTQILLQVLFQRSNLVLQLKQSLVVLSLLPRHLPLGTQLVQQCLLLFELLHLILEELEVLTDYLVHIESVEVGDLVDCRMDVSLRLVDADTV